MKRIVLSLMMAGGLALMAAQPALATAPGLCGHSYAMLMSGGDPTVVSATGASNLPGAVTYGYGVGVITFAASTNGTSCAVSSGELIYNAGDVQTNPLGLYFGPGDCYNAESGFGTGIPCFTGTDEMASGTLSNGGPGGSYLLTFAADYAWFDGEDTSGTVPFGFYVQNTLGSSIGVGISIPGTVNTSGCPSGCTTPGNGAPVLQITLEKIGVTPVGTTFGSAPYKGESALSCAASGANSTDAVAAGQAAGANGFGPTPTGGLEMTTGSLAIFSATQAGGQLSFNANDGYVLSGSGGSNTDCSFSLSPAGAFADGTSNNIASITGTGTDCSDDLTAGAGYATSAVQWGTSDTDNYTIPTGLLSTATGFVPLGGSSACTEYEQLPTTGGVTNLTSATLVAVNKTVSGYVKVTNPTEADCDIEIAMPTETNTFTGAQQDAACTGSRTPYTCCTGAGAGTCVTESCSLSLASFPGDVTGTPQDGDDLGPSAATQLATTNCTCSGLNKGSGSPASPAVQSTVTLSSEQCVLSGNTSVTVTCEN
jgi:hypothetical protein